MHLFCDYLICFLPVLAGCLALAEYLWVPNLKGNRSTPTYTYFLTVLIVANLTFVRFLIRTLVRKAQSDGNAERGRR